MTPTLLALLLAAPAGDADRLQGEWLFESATAEAGGDALPSYWDARLTFRKDTVAATGTAYTEAAVETTFALDPAASPKRMDWVVPEFYRTILKLPAGTAKGIYKFDGDTLTVCMANKPGGERPTEFQHSEAKGHFLFTVRRWTGKPGEKLTAGKITVLLPDGTPAVGATVERLPQRWHNDQFKPAAPLPVADAAGVARVEDAGYLGLRTARLAGRKLIGLIDVTPAGLHHGTLSVQLAPEVRITGKLAVDPPPAAGEIGWTNVYLKRPGPGGRFTAGYADLGGRFEFVAPPGEYELKAYGDVFSKATVPLTVPAGVTAVDVGTLTAPPTAWGTVVGKPNPGLPGVVKWVGSPSPPEAWAGKVVMLYFANTGGGDAKTFKLEEFSAIQRKHADKGLAVVGVYGDGTGQSLNPAAAAIELLKLPFPVALCGGLADDWGYGLLDRGRFRAAATYGAEPWPHGVLIDRKGVVRGRWEPDGKDDGLLAKLLAE